MVGKKKGLAERVNHRSEWRAAKSFRPITTIFFEAQKGGGGVQQVEEAREGKKREILTRRNSSHLEGGQNVKVTKKPGITGWSQGGEYW